MAVVFQMELRQSTRSLSEFSHQHLVEYFTSGAEAIVDGKASGEFRPEMPEKIAANCFFGAIDEMVTSWVLSEKDYPAGQCGRSLVRHPAERDAACREVDRGGEYGDSHSQ